jgi:hypothetical protein
MVPRLCARRSSGSGGGNGERAFGEESTDLCRSVWMLQQRPLLKVAITVPATLQQKVSALQCASGKEESFNSSCAQRLVVRTDRRLRITLWRPQGLA